MSGKQPSAQQPQQMLFFAEQFPQADGSIVVRAKRLVDGNEIGVRRALNILGFKDRETVYDLIKVGEIVGWKKKSKRDNGKYRIDLGSVLDYKERQKRAARGASGEK